MSPSSPATWEEAAQEKACSLLPGFAAPMGDTPGRWSQDVNTASGPWDSEKRRTVRAGYLEEVAPQGRPEQGSNLLA